MLAVYCMRTSLVNLESLSGTCDGVSGSVGAIFDRLRFLNLMYSESNPAL